MEDRNAEVQEVLDRISDAFYAVDDEFRFTYLNERAEDLLQADADDLLGERVWDAYPEATETDAYRALHEARDTQGLTEFEFYYEPLDLWVNGRVFPSETGLSVYFRDVTERKARERRLRRQRERLDALNDIHRTSHEINRALVEQSSRDAIERVVCDRLANSDSYRFAWVGIHDEETDDIVPSTAVNDRGYLDAVSITADDGPTGRGPAGTAFRTGEPQFVRSVEEAPEYGPWREPARERGFAASAALPIAYEDRTYGILNIYTAREHAFDDEESTVVIQLAETMGLAIADLEHQQELAHKSEQMEFVNRLVRHNLLNSLNVVDSRTEIVGRYTDPEGKPHLRTVRERTREMIDLIETLRSLMDVLSEAREQEPEPVDLGDVLRKEIEQAEQAFDGAVFEVDASLDDAGEVMVDDLLEEAIENLLSNAIRHNDKDVPRVMIGIDRGDEMTTVHVADNGPGVSEEQIETLFGKGEKGFESPGTGFGLYFVKEIVESYGGTVTVRNRDPEGAVFSISVPRA